MTDALQSSSGLEGLLAALSDSSLAVRIAVARAMVRLSLDEESSKAVEAVLSDFRKEDIFWSTFLPDEHVRDRVLELVQCTDEYERDLARATIAEANEKARATEDISFLITVRFAELFFHEYDEWSENLLVEAEQVARDVSELGRSYAPDVAGLFKAYLVWLRRADLFWFDWVEKLRNEYVPANQIPSWFPLNQGALAVSRQIEWAVSRADISAMLSALQPVLLSGNSRERFGAAQLIEWSMRTRSQISYWRFGGGAGPGDVVSARTFFDRVNPPAMAVEDFSYATYGEPAVPESDFFTVYPQIVLKTSEPAPPQAAPVEATGEGPDSQNTSGERTVNFWIEERENNPKEPLEQGVSYHGLCRVGLPVAANLLEGDSSIRDSDVPLSGLNTHWKLIPKNLRLQSVGTQVIVRDSGEADFDLLIPRAGNSETIRIGLTPLGADAGLTILIMVGDRLYRELRVALRVSGATTSSKPSGDVSEVVQDVAFVPLTESNVRPSHEWTTPAGSLTLAIMEKSQARIFGDVNDLAAQGEQVYVGTESAELSGIVDSLRKAAESLRSKATAYLNDVDPADLLKRLDGFPPQYEWAQLGNFADAAHVASWDAVASMKELQVLAYYGRRLYDTLFPPEQNSRPWMDALPPGQLVHVVWRPNSGANWIPHLPWELLYVGDAPPGAAIDPTQFWGLRYRIEYTAYNPPPASSTALGNPQEACCASLLFFGKSAKELAEVQWQRQVWSALSQKAKSCLLPAGTTSPKLEIVKALTEPESISGQAGVSAAVLYLFCHYGKDPTDAPILRFGDTVKDDDIVTEPELGTRPFASRPLVFANACASAGTGVYSANAVTKAFFDRGCRAFIGTDCMVPSAMASRFAVVFFYFFLRLADKEQAPMAAGEAMAQARLFLWCHYRNIGGLFYSYLNQYQLYMASAAEVRALRRKG